MIKDEPKNLASKYIKGKMPDLEKILHSELPYFIIGLTPRPLMDGWYGEPVGSYYAAGKNHLGQIMPMLIIVPLAAYEPIDHWVNDEQVYRLKKKREAGR